MMTPRQYLSWSQLDCFEKDPEKYKLIYIYGEEFSSNKGQKFGKKMADGLENDELTGDPVLDLVMTSIPKFELMDKIITDPKGKTVEYFDHKEKEIKKAKVPFVEFGKDVIPLLAKPDSMKRNGLSFKEYKTGQKRWTKREVDESGQITFYATALFLKTGLVPNDIELVQVMTEKDAKGSPDAELGATGEIIRIPTTRGMKDILEMMLRIKMAWIGIDKIYNEELL